MHSFLQTPQWLEFQKSLGRQVWRYDQQGIKATIIRHDGRFKQNYLYIPYGPHIDLAAMQGGIKNSLHAFFAYLQQLAQEQKSIFVKIEPQSDGVAELLVPNGLKKSNKHAQPQKTLVIDLQPEELEILGQMHHKTRYNINLAEKKDLELVKTIDVDAFWQLLKKTTERDGFSAHEKSYYQKLVEFFAAGELYTELFLVNHEGKSIAGAMIMVHGNTAYYLHGASDREYSSLMAPQFMHWHLMKYYKTQGIKFYDMWGIDAQQWPGVTRFKLGFGGRQVEYPGAFDLPIRKFRYWLYKLLK